MFGKMCALAVGAVLLAGAALRADGPADEAKKLQTDLARLRVQMQETEKRLTKVQEAIRAEAAEKAAAERRETARRTATSSSRETDERWRQLVERLKMRGINADEVENMLQRMRPGGFGPGGGPGGGMAGIGGPPGGPRGASGGGGFGGGTAGGGAGFGPPGGFGTFGGTASRLGGSGPDRGGPGGTGATAGFRNTSGFSATSGFGPALGAPRGPNPNEGIEQRLDRIANLLDDLTRELRTIRRQRGRGN